MLPSAALFVLALAGDPALAGGFECPDEGGAPWRELRTAHFVIQTDVSSSKAHELAEDLERIHETVRYGLFRKPPETGVIRVLAPAEREEFELFAPKGVAAFYTQAALTGPVIVLPGSLRDSQRVVAAHEITHHIAARVFARQPLWFAEGLATYMESVAQVGPHHTPSVGGLAAWRFAEVYPFLGGAAELLAARKQLKDSHAYAVAWALVQFLVNRHGTEFGQLQQRFARGQDPAVAWREVFPQWNPADKASMDALDGEIGRFLKTGESRSRDVELPPAPPVEERALSAAEAHGARLAVPWINQGRKVDPSLLRAEAEEALRHDPASVPALAVLSGLDKESAPALARRAVEGHPDDARAWLLFARSIPDAYRERRVEPLVRAARADPTNAVGLNDLAWELLGTGRATEALPIAAKAAGLAPGQSAILDTLAGALEAVGRCAEALQVERRALDVLSETTDDAARAPYLGRIGRLEKGCGPRVEASPAPAAPPMTR